MSAESPREPSFRIRTYGCQMNIHDTEKVANLLHHAGYCEAQDESAADLLVINTCSIREKAENRLYSDLGTLAEWKTERPGRVIAVGGCVAQQEGDVLLKRFRQVDFVFGTHNLRLVPSLVEAARAGTRKVEVGETPSLDRFELPERHPDLGRRSPGCAFLTVMEGCDMFCTFCIVPTTRGREISRPAASILEEARQLADGGVLEVTLLGQTVNAYGRHDVRRGQTAAVGTVSFAELLARLAEIPGLERIRYTSPHPLFFDEELVQAHAEIPQLCPHVHLPVQSGSDAVLARMRRRYSRDRYLEIVASLRAARPDVALTSDLIVGFPGETEADFEQTLDLVRQAGFVDSYSFKYSPRPGTPAAEEREGIVSPTEAQRRLAALQELQGEQTLAYHRQRVGAETEVLVEGESRRRRRPSDPEGWSQVSGRDPHHRVVNLGFSAEAGDRVPRAGTRVRVRLVEATPHSLIGELLDSAGKGPAVVKESARSAEERGRSAAPTDARLRVL